MNANLTISTLAFNTIYSDLQGSLRREVSRGPSIPTDLQIKHGKYVDSVTKLPGFQSVVSLDRFLAMTSPGVIAPVRVQITVRRPDDVIISSTDILAGINQLVNLLDSQGTGLDLKDEIFVNREQ